ncbi:MAG TPA: UDP-N-acetylmuramoyl-tripeptide--D-alanyl-D-alanine ligase, partial [Ramlibacter sp.]|nr:UDP-N-acetylmuramoyl-tripeptide--D-alanyl-D-alanine ligase [Ramlibacter sp.]
RLPSGMPGIEVDDTKLALGDLAAGWRERFALPLIAVTGSNGKTTVTQMIAAILRAWKPGEMLATEGNLNNDIGLPLTVLRLRPQHRVAVVELGMNHPGEIAYLANICRPTVALVNNAQREHQEFMASVEAVARENGSVLPALSTTGVAVIPAGEEFTPVWLELAGRRACLTFGDEDDRAGARAADVVLTSAQWQGAGWSVELATPAGPLGYRLRIAGRHNVRNSQAAVACALAAGAPLAAIAQGLEAFEPVKGRSRATSVHVGARAITVIDDTYNANPDSVRAAIEVLAELAPPRLLVLGDMGEVGDQGPALHKEVGEHARSCGIELLLTVGEQAAAMGGTHFADIDSLNAAVVRELPRAGSVLVKGSRFMRMERVIDAISAIGKEPPHAA